MDGEIKWELTEEKEELKQVLLALQAE